MNSLARQQITWVRTTMTVIPRLGNDDEENYTENIILQVLLDYNVKRVWPLTKYTDTGEEDKQSVVCILDIEYLRQLALLDDTGKFAYNPDKDKFIIEGITYYSAGDTMVSQAEDAPLTEYLILRRSDFAT